MSVDQILEQAESLSSDEKAELIDRLFISIGSSEQAEIDRAWAEEIERRIDACAAGQMEVEPVEDVIKALRRMPK